MVFDLDLVIIKSCSKDYVQKISQEQTYFKDFLENSSFSSLFINNIIMLTVFTANFSKLQTSDCHQIAISVFSGSKATK